MRFALYGRSKKYAASPYLCEMKKVVVGLSGGVDSSVAAHLLQEQGYEVIGLFMRNWHDADATLEADCPWVADSRDAMRVAEKLGIPFQVLDLSEAYKKRVVDCMFSEYEKGRTPNPDVLCNREIKFDVFLEAALQLGADYLATGHYCRKDSFERAGETYYRLLAGRDVRKDQSYFLCQLSQAQLRPALFPLGELEKSEVRAIARARGLPTAAKKDSQGLCFVGKIHLPEFLGRKLRAKTGQIIEIPADFPAYRAARSGDSTAALAAKYAYTPDCGRVVGTHPGAHFFTKGQRKGLRVGGTCEPLFVIDTDVVANLIYVGRGRDHPGLYRPALFIREADVHWVRGDLHIAPGERLRVHARIRYRQPLQAAELIRAPKGLYVRFDQAQSAVTEGQFCAWYLQDELIGSGVIH